MKISKKLLSLLLCTVILFGSVILDSSIFADVFDTFNVKSSAASGYKVGDIIEFGSYPQSEVTDSNVISALNADMGAWNSYEYYEIPESQRKSRYGKMKPGDCNWYKDVLYNSEKYRGVFIYYGRQITTVDLGSNQEVNGYLEGNIYWFKYEPIKWRVLDPKKGIVVSEIVLDSQPFNNYVIIENTARYGNPAKTYYANNYQKSDIRKWLNHNFYNSAFSVEQMEIIKTSCIKNPASSPEFSMCESPDVNDKIYLLSYDDLTNEHFGFPSDATAQNDSRTVGFSDYSLSQGLWIPSGFNSPQWWLRTPSGRMVNGKNSILGNWVSVVCNAGNIIPTKTYDTMTGVRPALTLDLSAYNNQNKPVTSRDIRTSVKRNEISFQLSENYTFKAGNLYNDKGKVIDRVDIVLDINNFNDSELNAFGLTLDIILAISNGIKETSSTNFSLNLDPIKGGYKRDICVYSFPAESIRRWLDGYEGTIGARAIIEDQNGYSLYDKSIFMSFVYGTSKAVIANGYDIETDSFSFKNLEEEIDFKYYKDVYGVVAGGTLWTLLEHNSSHGHCYGMAVVDGCLFENNMISVSEFSKNTISLLEPETISKNTGLSVSDYIKYGYARQHSWSSEKQRIVNKGIKKVYNYVKSSVSKGEPVLIDLRPNNHTVLAVGIDGPDILVYDSNALGWLERIIIKGDYWSYQFLNDQDFSWGSEKNSKINYQVLPKSDFFHADAPEDINGYNLVSSSSYLSIGNKANLMPIESSYSSENQTDSTAPILYWADSTETISVSNTSETSEEISIVSENTEIKVSVESGIEADLSITEDSLATVSLSGESGSEFEVTLTEEKDGELYSLSITGTANEDKISINRLNDDISIAGIQEADMVLNCGDETVDTDSVSLVESNVLVTLNEDAASSEIFTGIETSHTLEKRESDLPDCSTNEKNEFYYCTTCNRYYSDEDAQNEIQPNDHFLVGGHKFDYYTYNNDETCLADGTETALCEYCDATDTRTVEYTATGHVFSHYEYNYDATTEHDGTETAICEYCDEMDTRTAADTKYVKTSSTDHTAYIRYPGAAKNAHNGTYGPYVPTEVPTLKGFKFCYYEDTYGNTYQPGNRLNSDNALKPKFEKEKVRLSLFNISSYFMAWLIYPIIYPEYIE